MMKTLLGVLLLLPAASGDPTFTLSGTVQFKDPLPAAKPNKQLADDPSCCALHEKAPPKDNLVVGAKGGVRWAFVWVKKGLEGKTFKVPEAAAAMDQVGCVFTPHVLGIRAGQAVQFRNSDPMLHNVFGAGFANNGFNFGLLKGSVTPISFPNQEVMFKVSCSVHPFMAAWIGVVEHPFFAVTDAEGKFEIKNLPPGDYTLGVWHEGLWTIDEKNEVQVTVKVDAAVDFVMKKK